MNIPRLPVIITHIIGWVLFQSLPLMFFLYINDGDARMLFSSPAYWFFVAYYLVAFYLHLYVLLPKLYHRGKKWWYVISLVALVATAIYGRPFDRIRLRQVLAAASVSAEPATISPIPDNAVAFKQPKSLPQPIHFDIVTVFLVMMVVMFGIALDISRRAREIEQRVAAAEADRAHAELSFLKAQINPHFLFNTLNNIYSMAVMKHENTADMLMKLSSIMRYVTDEVTENFVPLQREIDCITDFINLQEMRLGKTTELHYTVAGDTTGRTIAPLLMMTFVENVFKYGVSKQEQSSLVISIDVQPDKICFFTQNRIFPQQEREHRKGIGISNTRKRLEYLYPQKHTLLVADTGEFFSITLCLNA